MNLNELLPPKTNLDKAIDAVMFALVVVAALIIGAAFGGYVKI